MIYKLKSDPAAEAVHDALPQAISEELSLALATACDDPLASTDPYGEDDPIVRTLVTPRTTSVLLIGHTLKTVTVLQITYLG
ncbi:hypothetical protein LKL35_27325 [Streptomyces sp. ET3-23]|uniref:hypothetical protein n=1 Tax=Streptomyces sp. ET3-23 TaxID=2885643 RepID=UPI001D115FDB|nr:hypothetical protein [Streptomyces sp. ET3-23]MCC2279109.1 hypothetical protein [Streptomyces sp. ET3-23]